MRYKYLFFLLAALLFVACSKDSDQAGGELVPVPGNPTPGNSTPAVPGETESTLNLVAATRALSAEEVSDATDAFSPIQLFLMSDNDNTALSNKREGQFTYAAGQGWSCNIGLKNTYNCIYGFSPSTAASATISLLDGETSYKNGAVLTLNNISSVAGKDICVIVGISHASNKNDVTAIPDRGKFYFKKNTQNYVSLLLDHLFAQINFTIKIDADYHELRSIKIKKLELLSNKTLTALTIPLTAYTSDKSPIGDVTYTVSDLAANDSEPTGVLYDYTVDTTPANSEGLELTVEGKTIPGFFAPDGAGTIGDNMAIRCTYDVYAYDVFDSKKCTRVRENCVSVNQLPTVKKKLADASLAPLNRGERTAITLTVKPTYLYQLSDRELDNPTIIVN